MTPPRKTRPACGDERRPAAAFVLPTAQEMRIRAEARLEAERGGGAGATPAEEAGGLLHELHVHQVELEMQNEELRRAQDALEAARTRYFDLYDMAPVGYVTLSEKNLIVEVNLLASTLLGLARSELERQPISRFIESGDHDVFYRHRRQLVEFGEAQVCELRMMRPDGGRFWARLDITAARDEGTGGFACRVTLCDITERKRIDAERVSLLDGELAARKKAEEALELYDEFISAAAHDFGTPLGVLRVQVEGMEKAIQERPFDPAWTEEGLKLIEHQTLRMVGLVNNLMSISRHGARRLDLRRSPCDLASLTRDVSDRQARELEKHGCELELVMEADVTGLWDKDGIDQVIESLLVNAIKFASGKPIRIEVTAAGRSARLTISDEGIGIPEDQLTRIFELYAKAHAEPHYGGLGIGLYVAQKIVTAHGGRLVASNRPEHGTVFTMDLPR